MIDLGIYEGDKVIVQKTKTAKNGDIVVAFIPETFFAFRRYLF